MEKKSVEVVLTKKSDIKTAHKARRAAHAALVSMQNGSNAGFDIWTSRAEAKMNELAKNNGLLPHGVSSKDVFIAVSDDCTRVMVMY